MSSLARSVVTTLSVRFRNPENPGPEHRATTKYDSIFVNSIENVLIAIIAILYSQQQSHHTQIMSAFDEQMEKVRKADGFVAALDQSGGSTPKALSAYGYPENLYVRGEESMFDAVHAMRSRIMTSPSFKGDRILAAILFENTMERKVNDLPTSQYLWEVKNVVPILKVSVKYCMKQY